MKTTKTILSAALALSMMFILTDCTGQKSDKAGAEPVRQTEKKAEQPAGKDEGVTKYKVTFIELGSVRCIPCQQMQPVMDTIRVRYPSQVNLVFHDVWTQQGAPFADKYGVSAIPTQVFLDENGQEYFRHVGFFPLEELVKILNQKGVN
jgi:thioredoxin 1